MTTLRGHHLICLHFYHGEGYSATFIEHLCALLAEAHTTDVVICEGADDVCRACPHLRGEVCGYSPEADGEIREMDGAALSLLGLSPGGRTTWGDLRNRVPGIFVRWHDGFCGGCDWRRACEKDHWYAALAGRLSEP